MERNYIDQIRDQIRLERGYYLCKDGIYFGRRDDNRSVFKG